MTRRPGEEPDESAGASDSDAPTEVGSNGQTTDAGQATLFAVPSDDSPSLLHAVNSAFDPIRLTQARHLGGRTKRWLADELGVSPVAVGHWESGTHLPRPDHLRTLADRLDVPVGFFSVGRPSARLAAGGAHFRSLRKTPSLQRARAIAFVEQIWELTYALEKRVEMPPVDLPGFSAGEVASSGDWTSPQEAAQALRVAWKLGTGPIPHLVRTVEHHGVIVTLTRFAGSETATVDAFSTSQMPRPIVVLTPDRADDIYRHRFTAAHELGHLLLHGDAAPGDPVQEKEADVFAAELLTPRSVITELLPPRMDLSALDRLSKEWGVGVDSLIYRCHEVGIVSESVYRRAFQRLNQLRKVGIFQRESIDSYPGEKPVLLAQAVRLAERNGVTRADLAREIACTPSRLRVLLGEDTDRRPQLRLL